VHINRRFVAVEDDDDGADIVVNRGGGRGKNHTIFSVPWTGLAQAGTDALEGPEENLVTFTLFSIEPVCFSISSTNFSC
jgi:hypothetical protein